MGKSKTRFQEKWLDTWSWVRPVKDSFKAGCKVCNTEFDVSNMGVGSLKSHEGGVKHKLAAENHRLSSRITTLFTKKPKPESSVSGEPIPEPSVTQTATSEVGDITNTQDPNLLPFKEEGTFAAENRSLFRSYLVKDEVTKAEILWTLNKITSHSSSRSQCNAVELFPLMFPGCEIAKKMQLHKDKISYYSTFGLGPYFENSLVNKIRTCEFFSVSFDESLNKISQKNQMDLIIRFWCPEKNRVVTRYLTSVFLGHTTAQDLMNAFLSALKDKGLDTSRLLQVSTDGPNVNLRFHIELKEYLRPEFTDNSPQLLETGTCSLHIVNGAFKSAHNKAGWSVNDFLRVLYYFFKDFPSRRADLITASQQNIFPLKFCSIRWVDNSNVISRAITMIPAVQKYIEHVQNKPPETKNFVKLKSYIYDPLLPARLGFLLSISAELEVFLTLYQSENPMLPYLWDDLNSLIRNLLSRFIKQEVLKEATSPKKLSAINVFDKKNLKFTKSIDTGFATFKHLKKIQEVDILQFKQECLTFLQELCKKLVNKCPLTYQVTKAARCFSPETMMNENLREFRISFALQTFVEMNQMAPSTADKVKREYLQFCANAEVMKELSQFKKGGELDGVLFKLMIKENVSSSLVTFMKKICVLFHGNASVERSFSINKDCLVENLTERSLIAQRLIYDGVKAANGIKNVDITKSMIHYVRNSSAKRKEALKDAKEELLKKEGEKKNLKKELQQLEISRKRILVEAETHASELAEKAKKIRQEISARE